MSKPILLVGEARGENEERIQSSFVGASGIELLKMLSEATIISLTADDWGYINKFFSHADPMMIEMVWRMHPEVVRTNVFNRHPPGNKLEHFCGPKNEGVYGYPALLKSKYVKRELIPELERLGDEISTLDPNLIVCLGNTPLWALGGTTGISKLRGTTRLSSHTATGYKLLPTYHPAAILRQWENRPIVVSDFAKAKREAEYPEIRRPKREIWIEPTLEDLDEFHRRYIVGCSILSVDIETAGNQITCIGFSPRPDVALVIPFFDSRRKGRSYWPSHQVECKAWDFVASVLKDPSIRKVFQNGLYDLAFLLRSVGLPTFGAVEDTMLLHHALQPESLKGLGFLGSIYSDEGAWKQDRRKTETIKADE